MINLIKNKSIGRNGYQSGEVLLSYSDLVRSNASAEDIHLIADKIQREFSIQMKLTSV